MMAKDSATDASMVEKIDAPSIIAIATTVSQVTDENFEIQLVEDLEQAKQPQQQRQERRRQFLANRMSQHKVDHKERHREEVIVQKVSSCNLSRQQRIGVVIGVLLLALALVSQVAGLLCASTFYCGGPRRSAPPAPTGTSSGSDPESIKGVAPPETSISSSTNQPVLSTAVAAASPPVSQEAQIPRTPTGRLY
jgi:hypothetical protein